MSENNEAGSFATAGSGKSDAEVAFDLLNKLKGQGVWGERNMSAILDMYAECLDAAKGYRSYAGQNRVEVPTQKAEPTKKAQPVQPATQTAPPQQAPTAPPQPQVQTQPAQAQPAQQQPVQAQPVHAQQQVLQQAFKQG